MFPILMQFAALLSNVISGIGVVLANKAVFVSAHFLHPVALTALHYAVNLVMLMGLAAFGSVRWRSVKSSDRRMLHTTTAVWALHNALSNFSLQRNSVGLYQVAKILVTPLICTIEYIFFGVKPMPCQALMLGGACVGVAFATVNDVQVDAHGAVTALASACASAVLKVLQQAALQRHGWTSLELMYRSWGPQLVLLLLSTPMLEPHWRDLASYELTQYRASLLLLSAVAAFALNVTSLVSIKLTSAITIVLLSQTKTVLTLLGGFLLYDAKPSASMLGGATLAIVSIGAYTYAQVVADKQNTRKPSLPVATPDDEDRMGNTPLISSESQPLRCG